MRTRNGLSIMGIWKTMKSVGLKSGGHFGGSGVAQTPR